ncbi:hypothetical protein SETIT_5G450400v2 [Setaria italica]|uniref:Reverse transcriptase zinc-binding domain-containing protein n=1 Tax=Setaria italica TaxID=4555 RepID=A0A368RG26_SETIT|nr:hypothetical protein SETIT_5G450400v2 [Setaria italica]
MNLDSYTCELCILQRSETAAHLFFRCNFAKACWNSIGISFTPTRSILRIVKQIKQRFAKPFFMEIVILLMWSIWATRNDWMFNAADPLVQKCKAIFVSAFGLLKHRACPSLLQPMEDWLNAL